MAELNIFQQVSKLLAIGHCMKIDCASIFHLILSTNFQYLNIQMLVSINCMHMHLIKHQTANTTENNNVFQLAPNFLGARYFPSQQLSNIPGLSLGPRPQRPGPGIYSQRLNFIVNTMVRQQRKHTLHLITLKTL